MKRTILELFRLKNRSRIDRIETLLDKIEEPRNQRIADWVINLLAPDKQGDNRSMNEAHSKKPQLPKLEENL